MVGCKDVKEGGQQDFWDYHDNRANTRVKLKRRYQPRALLTAQAHSLWPSLALAATHTSLSSL
jgi:hypothetical protein